jgi:hypothetical protein
MPNAEEESRTSACSEGIYNKCASDNGNFVMHITREQMAQFDVNMATVREVEFLNYARGRFPGRFDNVPDAALIRALHQARQRAAHWGLLEELDALLWFDLSVMYGARFDTQAWASDILALADLPSAQKVQHLKSRVRLVCPEF